MSTARTRGSARRNGRGGARNGRLQGWLDAEGKNLLSGVSSGKLDKDTFLACCGKGSEAVLFIDGKG